MRNKTRKYTWLASAVVAFAIVAALAAFIVVASTPGDAIAHSPGTDHTDDCVDDGSNLTPADVHDAIAGNQTNADGTQHSCANPGTEDTTDPVDPMPMSGDGIVSSSTSGGAGVKLTLTIESPGTLRSGSSIELYLEDDFQVPDDIESDDVYFIGESVGRVYVTDPIEIDDDDHFGGDDDWSIQVFVPDMNPDNEAGFDTWSASESADLQLVFTKSAGIKNPTEAGTHSVGYKVLQPGDDSNKSAGIVSVGTVPTYAKISLSDEEDVRGKEITVTGSGFNNGTGAEVYVYGPDQGYDGGSTKPTCREIVAKGTSLGTALVGSDDKFAVTFNVHQDDFAPGNVNHICAVDSEAGAPRFASRVLTPAADSGTDNAEVDTFELSPKIDLDPASGSYGDEITVKARDFDGQLTSITLGPLMKWTNDGDNSNDDFSVDRDGSEYTFELPGGLDERTQIAAVGKDGEGNNETERAYLTIEASNLTLSSSEVAANESIIIEGRGFDDEAEIPLSQITIDGEPLDVETAGTDSCENSSGQCIQIDSNGQFVVEARVWTDLQRSATSGNPALDADTYTIEVVDSTGFEGEADITILDPTVSVSPDTAGPRDYITVSGENWPVSNEDDDFEVDIEVDGRSRSATIDSSGRFRYEYRLSSGIALGEEHDVTVSFVGYGGDFDEEASFSTPDAGISVMPGAASPGDTISVELLGMPVFQVVSEVRIAGGNRLGGQVVNTDRDGNATVTNILVPAADPGHYSVRVTVGSETAVGQLEILDDSVVTGTATELPGAVSDLGDNLEAIFHFNNTSKAWTFYDPRPEFADLNTLDQLVSGQPYWVLVKDNQEDVDWNGRLVNFTCAAGDCWNLEIW